MRFLTEGLWSNKLQTVPFQDILRGPCPIRPRQLPEWVVGRFSSVSLVFHLLLRLLFFTLFSPSLLDFLLHLIQTEPGVSASCSLQAPPDSELMTQATYSRACRMGGVGSGPSFRTVSLSTWANRVSGKHGEREAEVKLVGRREPIGEGGLAEWQPMYNNISLPLWPKWALLLVTSVRRRFFFCSLFLAWSSLQWKHIPAVLHCRSLFRLLHYKQHYTQGLEPVGAQASERQGP